jgi:hypothetical protein
MPVIRKSTKRNAKTPASRKQASFPRHTLEELERALVECLIAERADLPALGISMLQLKEYKKLVALNKPITWSLIIRASAMRGKACLEVGKDLITERP